jgi:nucleoside 2-deoxyribosyltransferase
MNKKPRIYLAAPLFNRREHDFNLAIAVAISPYGEVFLPQRDGELLAACRT